jgi:predicted AlkP superfamily phosphohydrolase/phosphomutase
MNHQPSESPLVILGFDAGDPQLLQSWAQAGHLPTLASIMRRGVWTKTKGAELALEHGVWQSVFSGLSRGKHGCYYLRQLKPGS